MWPAEIFSLDLALVPKTLLSTDLAFIDPKYSNP